MCQHCVKKMNTEGRNVEDIELSEITRPSFPLISLYQFKLVIRGSEALSCADSLFLSPDAERLPIFTVHGSVTHQARS